MRPSDDARLLEHYLERGHEPWNVSLEAAWLDYELRRYVSERLAQWRSAQLAQVAQVAQPSATAGRKPRVLNVGIGVGLWDDWLAHAVGGEITSIDIDCDICEMFELRQARERHPFPARVVCGDLDALAGEQFDFITCIGSTLAESGAPDELREAMRALLAPGGCLVIGEVRPQAALPGVSLTWSS
jgi:SAM-dependent methyltransferase